MPIRRLLCLFAAALLGPAGALAADLTIGLGTDVTSLDPHYHNLTPNNNVAQHVFGSLVSATRRSSSSRASRRSGRRSTRRRGSSSCAAG
jgi:hypothetical protein